MCELNTLLNEGLGALLAFGMFFILLGWIVHCCTRG